MTAFRLIRLFVFMYLLPLPALSLKAPVETLQFQVPVNMSGVDFYLITVDVGDMVWDLFGHTALRVYDENTNTDTVFNWGVFDISGGVGVFSWNFFKFHDLLRLFWVWGSFRRFLQQRSKKVPKS